MGDERRLVALASQRDWGEEGGVGFDQDAVAGCEGRGIPNALGFGVSQVSGEGDVEAEVEGAAGVVDGAGEAVHDAGQAGGAEVLFDEVVGIGCGVCRTVFLFRLGSGKLRGSTVDDDGLAEIGGDFHLLDEGMLLDGDLWVIEVIVVQANLADGDAEGLPGEAGELGQGLRVSVMGLLWVDSGAGEELRQMVTGHAFGEVEREMHLEGVFADADGEDGADAGVPSAAENLVAVGRVRGVEVEMCVGVDEHAGFGWGQAPGC